MSGRTISVVSKRRGYKVSTGLIVNKLRIFYIFLLMSDCWGKKIIMGGGMYASEIHNQVYPVVYP